MVLIAACGGHGGRSAAAHDSPGNGSVPTLVSNANWTHPAEGYRLRVTPSIAGRNRAAGDAQVALDQALLDAGPSPFRLSASVRSSLLNQLHCHAVFARHKPRWNLEAWRPNVGYLRTVVALCNP